MSYEEILDELRGKLSGDNSADSEMLRELGENYGKEGNIDGVRAVGDLMLEIMPKEQRDEIENLTCIDGVRLDEFHTKIVKLINDKNMVEAKSLAEKLYAKIKDVYRETDKAKFVSFRNPFEDNLAQLLFETDEEKILNRAPFDFATFLTTYAYTIFETGSPVDAVPILEEAIGFNPVDCGPRFELAECYKILKNKDKLIKVTQDILAVASSPIAIARCYANMGYLCFDLHELDDAARFYYASLIFAPHPAIPHELRAIAQMKNAPIEPPDHKQIMATMEKYGIHFGPDEKVITVAAQIASDFMLKQDIPNAVMALKLLYNITQDESVKELILKYDSEAKEIKSNGAAPEGSV